MRPILTSLAFGNPDKDKEPISENTTSTGHSVGAMLKKQYTAVPLLINKLTHLTTEMQLVFIQTYG
jgi:hypothetical protein